MVPEFVTLTTLPWTPTPARPVAEIVPKLVMVRLGVCEPETPKASPVIGPWFNVAPLQVTVTLLPVVGVQAAKAPEDAKTAAPGSIAANASRPNRYELRFRATPGNDEVSSLDPP
jgi:hypothetical protein